MERVPIICLATSKKHKGCCVAGRRFSRDGTGEWIRPVTYREGHGLRPDDMRYGDSAQVSLLDIAEVPLLRARPSGYQTENFDLDRRTPWRRLGRASWTQVLQAEDTCDDDFWEDYGSTRHGLRDKIPGARALSLTSSLKLIYLPLGLRMMVGWEAQPLPKLPKRTVRAEFDYGGSRYRLMVTDPVAIDWFMSKSDGVHGVPTAMLCVSLCELFRGATYRLVAAIITPRRCEIRS